MTKKHSPEALARMKQQRRRQRAAMERKGLRRVHGFYVHMDDFPRVVRYINAVNARRFPNGERPPVLMQERLTETRPRGGVTLHEAAARLGLHAKRVRSRVERGLIEPLRVSGYRTKYYTEESVRRAAQEREGLNTRAASRYLAVRGVVLSPKTLINRRFKGLAPAFTVGTHSEVRYARATLNQFIGKYKAGDA